MNIKLFAAISLVVCIAFPTSANVVPQDKQPAKVKRWTPPKQMGSARKTLAGARRYQPWIGEQQRQRP